MSLSPTPAVQAFLADDAPLASLAPGGVWEDPAPDVPELFVGLSLVASPAERCGGGNYVLQCSYEISGVAAVTLDRQAIAACRAVQQRIHDLLHAQPITLTGWKPTTPQLEALIERTQSEALTGQRWILRGGRYRWVLEPA